MLERHLTPTFSQFQTEALDKKSLGFVPKNHKLLVAGLLKWEFHDIARLKNKESSSPLGSL